MSIIVLFKDTYEHYSYINVNNTLHNVRVIGVNTIDVSRF